MRFFIVGMAGLALFHVFFGWPLDVRSIAIAAVVSVFFELLERYK